MSKTVSSSPKADFKPVHMPLHLNESANVDRFVKLFKGRFMFVPAMGWYEWDGNRWAADELGSAFSNTQAVATVLDMEADSYINSPTGQSMEEEEQEKIRKNVAAWKTKSLGIRNRQALLAGCEAEMAVKATDLNKEKWDLVVRNGTLDLRTGELRSSVPEDLNTQCASVDFVEGSTCPKFDELLKYAFDGDEEMIAYVWRILGYTLTGSVGEQSFFFLHGVRGSGKSTICEVMVELLGDYGMKMDEESLFGQNQHPTWIADLLGKRMLFKDELNQKRKINTALVNTLVSGGNLRGRKMRRDFTDVPMQGKLYMATNHKPPMGSSSDGIWRRIKPVHFAYAVPEETKVLDYAKILAEEEGSGILLRCLDGLRDYLDNGMKTPSAVKADAEEYKDAEDELTPFVLDVLEKTEDDGDWICNEDLYAAYKAWCEAGGIKPLTSPELGKHLSEQGFTAYKPCKAVNLVGTKMTKRGWVGVKFSIESGSIMTSPQVWKRVK